MSRPSPQVPRTSSVRQKTQWDCVSRGMGQDICVNISVFRHYYRSDQICVFTENSLSYLLIITNPAIKLTAQTGKSCLQEQMCVSTLECQKFMTALAFCQDECVAKALTRSQQRKKTRFFDIWSAQLLFSFSFNRKTFSFRVFWTSGQDYGCALSVTTLPPHTKITKLKPLWGGKQKQNHFLILTVKEQKQLS